MTATVTNKDPKVINFGNVKAKVFDVSIGASDTSAQVKTGLQNVLMSIYVSKVDDAFDIYDNYSDAGSTAAFGTVFLNNLANSAVGKLLVIGI